MRVNDDYKEWNVAAQLKDPESVFNFWRQALALRKQHEVLVSAGLFFELYPSNS